MSRRPLLHPVGRLAKAQQRMAPGGLLWSESPIPRRYSPRVPMVGDDTPAPGEICVDLVADPDGHTFRPAAGTFGAPTGAWFGISLVLGAAIGAGEQLEYWMYTTAGVDRILAVDGPYASGATVAWDGTQELASPGPEWEWMTLSIYPGGAWVTATGVRFCYTTTPPTTAAVVTVRSI